MPDSDAMIFELFPLHPPSDSKEEEGQGKRGCEVLGGSFWIPSAKLRRDEAYLIFICTPFLAPSALQWLGTIIGKKQPVEVYILTSGRNDPDNNAAIKKAYRELPGDTHVTVYKGTGNPKQQRDPLLHSKLYLCATGPRREGFLSSEIDWGADYKIHSAWFGSMNFTASGLGCGGNSQSYELLARAVSIGAKKRLARQFCYYWCRGGVKRPPSPEANTYGVRFVERTNERAKKRSHQTRL